MKPCYYLKLTVPQKGLFIRPSLEIRTCDSAKVERVLYHCDTQWHETRMPGIYDMEGLINIKGRPCRNVKLRPRQAYL